MTCYEADAGVLTIVYHDRDQDLSARDLLKFLIFNWFIIGLFLGFVVAFSGTTYIMRFLCTKVEKMVCKKKGYYTINNLVWLKKKLFGLVIIKQH